MILKIINTGSRHGNSYALAAESGEILMLDAGCRYGDILSGIGYRVADIAGLLLTHEHRDHCWAYANFLRGGIPAYGSAELADALGPISGMRVREVPELRQFRCGGFAVTPFNLPHTKKGDGGGLVRCMNYGYLIEHDEMGRLIYMTDFEYCPYNFRRQRINHFLTECNYQPEYADRDAPNFRHRMMGHCSLDTCSGMIGANRTPALRTVTLCHLSDAAADPCEARNAVRAAAGDHAMVYVAEAGLEIMLREQPF